MSVELDPNIVHDVRQPIVGDSFSWYATEPVAAKKSFVIHATASDAPQEDAFVIADYHVNHNGWGGIGVHFVCTKDSYSGKPQFGLPAGAHIQYAGDLGTWRAGCANQNPGRVHIEISGNFVNGHPSEGQLRQVRKLIDYLLAKNNILPSFNYYNQVTYHNAVPEQQTECPGWQSPSFNEWFKYLQGGPEPSWFSTQQKPAPAPTPPAVNTTTQPQPVPVAVTPDYISSYRQAAEKNRPVLPAGGTDVVDAATGKVVTHLNQGQVVQDIAGYFTRDNVEYARTAYSEQHNLWNGIKAVDLGSPEVVSIPVTVDPNASPANQTPAQLAESFKDLGPEVQQAVDSNWSQLWDHLRQVLAILISPLLKVIGRKQ